MFILAVCRVNIGDTNSFYMHFQNVKTLDTISTKNLLILVKLRFFSYLWISILLQNTKCTANVNSNASSAIRGVEKGVLCDVNNIGMNIVYRRLNTFKTQKKVSYFFVPLKLKHKKGVYIFYCEDMCFKAFRPPDN